MVYSANRDAVPAPLKNGGDEGCTTVAGILGEPIGDDTGDAGIDRIPHLNVEALCKATSATDKAMGLALAQSFEACMRDETTAQQQLTAIWQANPAPVRERCAGEAMMGDSQSYVDLLTCLQAADIVKAVRRATVTPETQPSNKHSTTRALPNLHRRTLVVLVYFLNAGFVSDDGRTLGR